MKGNKIACYLCNSPASEGDAPNASRNILIECTLCKPYLLTTGVMMYYINRDDKEALNDIDKKKLVYYVQQEFEQTQEPVLINITVVEKVTGKKSVNW